jgi:hypothetical protein
MHSLRRFHTFDCGNERDTKERRFPVMPKDRQPWACPSHFHKPTGASATEPAFVARPDGVPVYRALVIVEDGNTHRTPLRALCPREASMIGLDTNIVVRYLTQGDLVQSLKATENDRTPTATGKTRLVGMAETAWVLDRACGFAPQEIALPSNARSRSKSWLSTKSRRFSRPWWRSNRGGAHSQMLLSRSLGPALAASIR